MLGVDFERITIQEGLRGTGDPEGLRTPMCNTSST
jgi:hypothetical protein